VWGPFFSASSSLLTLARPALVASLAGRDVRSWLGLRAHRQPDKPTLRLGTLSCLQHFLFVLLDQRFAIDPCLPSVFSLAAKTVTSLEPRTPHQPEKPKKLSKNEYLFTPSKTPVNEKSLPLTPCLFNRVHAVHKPLTGFGAAPPPALWQTPRATPLLPTILTP
jgi:hypothetical protein